MDTITCGYGCLGLRCFTGILTTADTGGLELPSAPSPAIALLHRSPGGVRRPLAEGSREGGRRLGNSER
jgi:hypothetical protein